MSQTPCATSQVDYISSLETTTTSPQVLAKAIRTKSPKIMSLFISSQIQICIITPRLCEKKLSKLQKLSIWEILVIQVQFQLFDHLIIKKSEGLIQQRSESTNRKIDLFMSKYKYEKEFMFSERKVDDIRLFLKDKQNLDISQIKDDKLNTVLHQSSYQGSLPVLKQYVYFMRRFWKNQGKPYQQVKDHLKRWVNQINKQGFSCLHYAAYKGEIQILSYLDELQADCTIKTNSGLGVLHLASQGDKVKTFIFYRKKIDINIPDEKLSTPLHWAAYSGSQKVIEYILSQKKTNLNPQDSDQQTPLHLATAYGNTKIVRRLLIAGANRHIKNKERQQPIQIARQNEFHSIENFLNDDYKLLDYLKFFLNIKIKYEPKKRSVRMPLLFITLSLVLIAAITLGIEYHDQFKAIFYIQEGLFLVLMLLYFSLIVEPKRIKKGKYQSIVEGIYKNQQSPNKEGTVISSSMSNFSQIHTKINEICLRCVQFKPHRSYHCDVCDTCVQQYDHHCPWINNCVGKSNIRRFIVFLALLFLVLNWILVVLIQFILVLAHDKDDQIGLFQISGWLQNIEPLMYGFVGITSFLYIFFFIPLFFLICVQIYNLLLGKTTYERFSKANQSILSPGSKEFVGSNSAKSQKKGKKLSCINCFRMCYPPSDRHRLLLQ